jgi:hypothetical protein
MAATMANNDDPAVVQARHAEIQRRYRPKWDSKNKGDRIKSVRRKQVLHLLQDRHGPALPDDAAGRAALQILFELGLDGPAAQRLATWADGPEIERLIAAADRNWRAWSKRRDQGDPAIDPKLIPERLGERLELSFEEYRRLRLSRLRPCDTPRHEVDKYIRDGRRKRDADRKRHEREQAKQMRSAVVTDPWDLPDGRAKALACAPLADRAWWSVRALTDYALERLGAFEGLDYAACRKATLRTVRELQDLGIVEAKTEPGPRGLKVLYARRLTTAAEIEAERQQLRDEVAAEQQAPEVT